MSENDADMANSTMIVDYGTDRRGRSRKRLLRRVLILSGCVLLVALGVKYGRRAADKYALLRVQRQCLDYAPAPGSLVFEFTLHPLPVLPEGMVLSNYWAAEAISRRSPEWTAFQSKLPGGFTCRDNVVFMHERHCIGGPTRLVVVQVARHGFDYPHPFWVTLISPATATSPPQVVMREGDARYNDSAFRLVEDASFVVDSPRLLATAIDQADPSHFTMDYVLMGVNVRLHGALGRDDTVTFTVHDIPEELRRKGFQSQGG